VTEPRAVSRRGIADQATCPSKGAFDDPRSSLAREPGQDENPARFGARPGIRRRL